MVLVHRFEFMKETTVRGSSSTRRPLVQRRPASTGTSFHSHSRKGAELINILMPRSSTWTRITSLGDAHWVWRHVQECPPQSPIAPLQARVAKRARFEDKVSKGAMLVQQPNCLPLGEMARCFSSRETTARGSLQRQLLRGRDAAEAAASVPRT